MNDPSALEPIDLAPPVIIPGTPPTPTITDLISNEARRHVAALGDELAANLSATLTEKANAAATVASAAAIDTANKLHEESISGIVKLSTRVNTLASDVADNRAGLEEAFANAGQATLTAVSEDAWLQRAVVLSVVAGVLVGALMVLAFALLGNATANKWVGAAPAAIVALVLWLSRAGVSLPTKATGKQA